MLIIIIEFLFFFFKAQISVNYVEKMILSDGTAGAKLSVFCHRRRLKMFCGMNLVSLPFFFSFPFV